MKQNEKTYRGFEKPPVSAKTLKKILRQDKINSEEARLHLEAKDIIIPKERFRLIFPSGVLNIELRGSTFCMSVEPKGRQGRKH